MHALPWSTLAFGVQLVPCTTNADTALSRFLLVRCSARPGAPRVTKIAGSMGALDVFLTKPAVLGGPGGEQQCAWHMRNGGKISQFALMFCAWLRSMRACCRACGTPPPVTEAATWPAAGLPGS